MGQPTNGTGAPGPGVTDAERLVADAVAVASGTRDDPRLTGLVAQYWRLVPDEDVSGRTPRQIVQTTQAHRVLAAQRLPGELKLSVEVTGGDGSAADVGDGRTVIAIVTDDMPFLVDSVTGALATRGLDIHLLVHPVFVVRRAGLGALEEIRLGVDPGDAARSDLVESWMRVEVEQIGDPAARAALRADLARVLSDVREAVEDWPKMRRAALALADELAAAELPVPGKDVADSIALLRWLADDHFTFLGYREYRLVDGYDGEKLLEAVLGSGLGILRADSLHRRRLPSMSPEAYSKALEKRLLIITKANSRSRVHRNVYLDYIGFKTFDEAGNVSGERRFVGLFASSAYRTSVTDLPVVRRKVAEVIERSGLAPRSHSGKDLTEILETYPRDELFQIATDDLYRTVMGVLRLAGRRQLRVFLRNDAYGRFISCLVHLPRDRYTTANRLKIQQILLRRLGGLGVDYSARVGDSLLARIHLIVRTDPANPPRIPDEDALGEELAAATRLWDEDFRLVLEQAVGEAPARHLHERYRHALPDTYTDEHSPAEAAQDVAKFELLDTPGQLVVHLYRHRKDDADVRFKVFRYGEPMLLSAVLPVLHSLGLRVTDERPYQVRRADGTVYLYDFGIDLPAGARALNEVRTQVENAFAAVWRGEAEIDGFNALVLSAGLTWRQVVLLRAYAKYLRQAGTVFSQEYLEAAVLANPAIASNLVALFEAWFDPGLTCCEDDRALRTKVLLAEIEQQLDEVRSLDEDRILRSYRNLIQATLRTSFFQRDSGGRPKPYVAFKLDPRAIEELPEPRPRYEIFGYSPRFEGVHLRFGAVARGGLRWSDRREDFRTEVLGLVKAQLVKNALIVPTGAKGGFVVKRRSPADRAEGEACYRQFVSALLDVTDNRAGGAVVPPPDVVRRDGDDPYLVVAADKGTATFSDIANEISVARGFWLGDAFASGGSTGYDHKRMGITARGAWVLVGRRFAEIGLDPRGEDFTVVGIGDMSGDVFGNGMLCSEHIRLVAAFDHRHVFVDPEPDPAASYRERRRLFELPGSSWDDYDRALISAGGGVWPRSAKSIPVSPQARRALGIVDTTVTALPPGELIRAILCAPVDLLFNGGIGTYVKASAESPAQAGDKANDALRVNGRDLRCRVVGEGGNLGFTQRGRIEYAVAGGQPPGTGQIGTDFIDNSAGVDLSDREVNIKIMLDRVGASTPERRNGLLADAAGEVAELVLRDNHDQATALGLERSQSAALLPVHQRMIIDLERRGLLDRALEALPDHKELAARATAGAGLTTPELAVLLSYSKIAGKSGVLESALVDEAWTGRLLLDYFPTALRERFAEQIADHPLRREIVATGLVNEALNRGGASFAYRAVEETGAGIADVIRAYVVIREVYGLAGLWHAIEATDGRVPVAAQTAGYLEARRLLDRGVRWLVTNRRSPIDVPGEIDRFAPGVGELLPQLGVLFRGRERGALHANTRQLRRVGLPTDLAEAVTRLMYGFGLLDVVETARTTGAPVGAVAGVYYVLSERFRVDNLLSGISALPRADRWQAMARMALRYDLYAALAGLTAQVLAATPAHDRDRPEERVSAWERSNAAAISRARTAIAEFEARAGVPAGPGSTSPGVGGGADLAALSVLLRQIRTLLRTASP